MFYRFRVTDDHRHYLRFLWYRDNDTEKELVEYRMTVHVFGNSPLPAVANYGLKHVARLSEDKYGEDVTKFVERNFYVDDGLASKDTKDEAIRLMTKTQEALKENGNIRLHKIASNDIDVMQAFPSDDLAKRLREVTITQELLPLQHCLGLVWNLNTDYFTFRQSCKNNPTMRRTMLLLVNSIYDPLGIIAPVTIQCKILLRDVTAKTVNWDEPLPESDLQSFHHWSSTLSGLKEVTVSRVYTTIPLGEATKMELIIFSDASEKSIAAVVYLKTTRSDGTHELGFVMGKCKVAPTHGHTIPPRLELCAAVLAIQLYETVIEELELTFSKVKFFTDSKVVLGYIFNQRRRFYVYVGNRVDRIRESTRPDQWNYVPIHRNPADCGTRSTPVASVAQSMWLIGPPSLPSEDEYSSEFKIASPDADVEIRPDVVTMVTRHEPALPKSFQTDRFERFSVWKNLIRAIATLQHISQSFRLNASCIGWHLCKGASSVSSRSKAENSVINLIQQEHYGKEISNLQTKKPVSRDSPIRSLNPVLDCEGILRVGGRLNVSAIHDKQKNPVIIHVPGHSHIGVLLARHYHNEVKHQGRHFTEGCIRAAGFWITACKRLVSSIIHKCVICRKLRGKFEKQLMADLPKDRLTPAPAIMYVGVDTFGPCSVVARKTRGGQATNKRWAMLFTCLVIRAIHIEVVEEMSSSPFINALRRFISIRGNVKEFRLDCGTNFVGSLKDLKIDAINVEGGSMNHFLSGKGVIWKFNPPHASHFGGVWERMIGVSRLILDSLLSNSLYRSLTHDVLVTFIAEVCCIVNARPVVPVSTDGEIPEILSPATLLMHKSDLSTTFYTQLDMKDMYRAEWKRVQALAESFGSDGAQSMSTRCKPDASGPRITLMLKSTMSSS